MCCLIRFYETEIIRQAENSMPNGVQKKDTGAIVTSVALQFVTMISKKKKKKKKKKQITSLFKL